MARLLEDQHVLSLAVSGTHLYQQTDFHFSFFFSFLTWWLKSALLIFKAPEVKPHWFSQPGIRGICLLNCEYPVPRVPSVGSDLLLWQPSCLWLVLPGVWLPTVCLSLLPFSTWPPVYDELWESLPYQSSGRFQSWLHRWSCYLGMSVGQGELRILPFCHFPDSPCWLIIITKTRILLGTVVLRSVLRSPATH